MMVLKLKNIKIILSFQFKRFHNHSDKYLSQPPQIKKIIEYSQKVNYLDMFTCKPIYSQITLIGSYFPIKQLFSTKEFILCFDYIKKAQALNIAYYIFSTYCSVQHMKKKLLFIHTCTSSLILKFNKCVLLIQQFNYFY